MTVEEKIAILEVLARLDNLKVERAGCRWSSMIGEGCSPNSSDVVVIEKTRSRLEIRIPCTKHLHSYLGGGWKRVENDCREAM